MKLYTLDLMVLGYKSVVAHVPLTLKGGRPHSDEGPWNIRESDSGYFGRSSGWWSTHTDDDGFKEIWLMEAEDPNFISWLWRDIPHGVGHIQGILKLPLFLGETGTGLAMPLDAKISPHSLGWKVTYRGF